MDQRRKLQVPMGDAHRGICFLKGKHGNEIPVTVNQCEQHPF